MKKTLIVFGLVLGFSLFSCKSIDLDKYFEIETSENVNCDCDTGGNKWKTVHENSLLQFWILV